MFDAYYGVKATQKNVHSMAVCIVGGHEYKLDCDLHWVDESRRSGGWVAQTIEMSVPFQEY